MIERIRRKIAGCDIPAPDGLRVGIGDDCAVTRSTETAPWDELLTSDAVIENVHFLPSADAASVGHKAIARCLSDVAAMGGEPRWALVNLVAPRATPLDRVDDLMAGLIRTARACSAAVVGGDVAEGPVLEVHVFLTGRVPAGTAVLRSGARPGDALFVTGCLGGSAAGHHLAFQPRLAEGNWLRAGGWATAMIDLSDGLGLDAVRLLTAAGVAGRIFLDRIPVAEVAKGMADGRTALEHALGDGEDYELLFSVNAAKKDIIQQAWSDSGPASGRPILIGEIVEGPAGRLEGVTADGRTVALGDGEGYEHFGNDGTANPIGGGNPCPGC